MAVVKKIPAKPKQAVARQNAAPTRRKVAAYARVSTDRDEQFTSYTAQIDYYTRYIHARPDWEFAGMYTDGGISGTSMKYREGFKQMIADALAGKIDLIVTKSVSRFARNTVDSLTTIRKLKEHGTECYFEKENIWTFDGKGELLITIMSSLAQEESRSISENVTWGQRKRFADGKVSLPYGHFLGYEKGPDGLPQIVPEEAEIVRDIYRMFISGLSTNAIAKRLTGRAIPTPAGKDTWRRQTVESILRNEKYKGSALLQKRFTVDFLQKKMKVNEGEVPNTMWSTATRPSSCRRSGKRCSWSLPGGETATGAPCATAPSRESWCAATAERSTAPRCGTPPASTAGPYGSATPSSRASTNAGRPICTRTS